jgi:hypothetical protein
LKPLAKNSLMQRKPSKTRLRTSKRTYWELDILT